MNKAFSFSNFNPHHSHSTETMKLRWSLWLLSNLDNEWFEGQNDPRDIFDPLRNEWSHN